MARDPIRNSCALMAVMRRSDYGESVFFGPFFRRESPTQNSEAMRTVLSSGELWGRAPRNSNLPAAQAFIGALPDGESGFEFYANVPPDSVGGGRAFWHVRDDGSVWGDDEWAKVKVVVSRVNQDL